MADAPKLAQTIARRIEGEILRLKHPPGRRLGTERELLERYGVSRAVLREAIRIVERHGLGETRRGAGGGLFVARPAREAIAGVLSGYLESHGLELSELFEARRSIECTTARYAAERITEAGAAELEALVAPAEAPRPGDEEIARHERFHTQIAEIARSPALALFVLALHRISQDIGVAMDLDLDADHAAVWRTKRRIARAIARGDGEQAQHRMEALLREREEFLGERGPPPPHRRRRRRGKLAETLARQIADEIRRHRWGAGRRLGSEVDLVERYGVSRAILREAVRMLEQHSVAEMRRGAAGGLFVSEADPSVVVTSASVYVAHLKLDARSLHEARAALEPTAAELAATRASREELLELEEALELELGCRDEEMPVVGRALHELVADLTGNRAIALFSRVLITSAWGDPEAPTVSPPAGWQQDLRDNHLRLVAAIRDRDAAGARKAMEAHLELTTGWWARARPHP